MIIKKYIDYLFWKRTWFRIPFIVLPTLAIIITILINDYMKEKVFNVNKIASFIYLVLFSLAMYDNKDVDKPKNPFKKISKDEK